MSTNMKKSEASQGESASALISKKIAELRDWRGETLGRMRKLIKEADPDVVEEWKWMGTPVWSHDGIMEGVLVQYVWPARTDAPNNALRQSGAHVARSGRSA